MKKANEGTASKKADPKATKACSCTCVCPSTGAKAGQTETIYETIGVTTA